MKYHGDVVARNDMLDVHVLYVELSRHAFDCVDVSSPNKQYEAVETTLEVNSKTL